MRIRDLFAKDVTRDIPPVVYFHEQHPEKLAEEVGEYIITGGYPTGDPRARRVERGIHEAFVGLLNAMAAELDKPRGPELPASWISGFYGSGKSSFAKLLGLALDGVTLPDDTSLADALLARDDTPRRQELVDAWQALRSRIDPIAVVFDIGSVARDSEHIHSAALRQLQLRLGYCPKSSLVATWELRLERDDLWPEFGEAALRTLGMPWAEAAGTELAEDHFSHVLHVLQPERYPTPTEWIDSHAGTTGEAGTAPLETIDAISSMLELRAPGRTLLLVIDEVSQYVHQDDNRMLKLQSFVSELGKRLRGRAWILATGQQKLDETGETLHISKLKDRFPERLRVHLGATNIRDVVHKRLLRKRPEAEAELRRLLEQHRADLKLYGYGCEELTEEDFVEVYPLLPGHVDLLLQITSSLRTRSSRVQGDDHSIRGLLQLLGELFRSQGLAEQEIGSLITLDAIYAVQYTALDPDVQTAMARIAAHPVLGQDSTAQAAARAVALLELIQEKEPTTPELVAACLYPSVGAGNRVAAIGQALERLREENLLGFTESHGYKVQSLAGQEWERERRDVSVTADRISTLVLEELRELIAGPERPRFRGTAFPWTALYSDGRSLEDEKITDARTGAAVIVDLRFLKSKSDRISADWVQRSDQEPLRDRIVWVMGEPGEIDHLARETAQARHMIERYQGRRDALPQEKQRLLLEEMSRKETLEKRLVAAVADAFHCGELLFRGSSMRPADYGASFATALTKVAERWLPELFPYFTELAITDSELSQLMDRELSGPSTKLMGSGLGILALDEGRYVATCEGEVPQRILQFLEAGGAAGTTLLLHFSRPPYGYSADVVKACVAGLLRSGKIRIEAESGERITSVNDPGARDLLRKTKEGLGRASILPHRDARVSQRDRIAIGKMLESLLGAVVDRENDAIADAVFQYFPRKRRSLGELETRIARLPGRPEPPEALQRLGAALEACMRSRHVEDIVVAVKEHLDPLRDGLEQLAILSIELDEDAVQAVVAAGELRDHQLRQLDAVGQAAEVATAGQRLESQLGLDRPWRELVTLEPDLEAIRAHYRQVRRSILDQQTRHAEAARRRLKTRKGFERLEPDQAHQVLRPIREAMTDTTEDAQYPALAELSQGFEARLHSAEDQAHRLLDEALSRLGRGTVVPVQAGIHGRELSRPEELEAMLDEIDERIRPHLERGDRVRLV